jgi:NAD(P)-dependent dehydrogenase (short-subunit alcohol dehydrogenase family)
MGGDDDDLAGRTVLVTGAAGGLGRATAAALAARGARVLAHARGREAATTLAAGGPMVPVWGDLGSLAGVAAVAEQVRAAAPVGLHVLVNNAGAAFARRELSPDGIERTMAVDHVAPAALTAALLAALRAGAERAGRPSRVVNVSSSLERRGDPDREDWTYADRYRQLQAYCDAKLANLAHTYVLADELAGTGVTVNAADPGVVATGFGRSGGLFGVVQAVGRPFLAKPERAAATAVRLAADPALDGVTGGFYRRGEAVESSAASRDAAFGRRVHARTAELVRGAPD